MERRVGWGFISLYALAFMSTSVLFLPPLLITLPLKINSLVGIKEAPNSLALVAGIGALVSMIANPFFGRMSDRTSSRLGMRRPWMVIGFVGGSVGIVVIALAPNIPVVLLGWCMAQLFFNALLAAQVAVVPDQVQPAQRGMVSGVLGVCLPTAAVTGTFLVRLVSGNQLATFLVPCGIAGFFILLFAVVLIEVATGFSGLFSGFKTVFIVLVLVALSLRIVIRGTNILGGIAVFVVLLGLGVFWTAVKSEYREVATAYSDSQTIQTNLTDRASVLIGKAIRPGEIEWGAATDQLLRRIAYIDFFGAAIGVSEISPEPVTFARWRDALEHVAKPRILFPDKAALDDTEIFVRYVRDDVGADQGHQIAGPDGGLRDCADQCQHQSHHQPREPAVQ